MGQGRWGHWQRRRLFLVQAEVADVPSSKRRKSPAPKVTLDTLAKQIADMMSGQKELLNRVDQLEESRASTRPAPQGLLSRETGTGTSRGHLDPVLEAGSAPTRQSPGMLPGFHPVRNAPPVGSTASIEAAKPAAGGSLPGSSDGFGTLGPGGLPEESPLDRMARSITLQS